MFEIDKNLYFKLLLASEKLKLLEAGGVDNWEWYSESIYNRLYTPDNKNIEDIEEELKTKLNIE